MARTERRGHSVALVRRRPGITAPSDRKSCEPTRRVSTQIFAMSRMPDIVYFGGPVIECAIRRGLSGWKNIGRTSSGATGISTAKRYLFERRIAVCFSQTKFRLTLLRPPRVSPWGTSRTPFRDPRSRSRWQLHGNTGQSARHISRDRSLRLPVAMLMTSLSVQRERASSSAANAPECEAASWPPLQRPR
jgi:hypothetical protein